jgi:hypothetical protein
MSRSGGPQWPARHSEPGHGIRSIPLAFARHAQPSAGRPSCDAYRSPRSAPVPAGPSGPSGPPITADIAAGASRASWPAGGPTAGYGRVLVNGTLSVKASFAGHLFRLHRQSAGSHACGRLPAVLAAERFPGPDGASLRGIDKRVLLQRVRSRVAGDPPGLRSRSDVGPIDPDHGSG